VIFPKAIYTKTGTYMDNKVKQNMLWNSIGSIIYVGGQWLLSVLVVRMLGYGEAGTLSLAMSLTNSFYSLANYGIRNFQVSDLKGQFSDKEYLYNRMITSGIAFILCLLYCFLRGYEAYACIAVFWFMCFRICEAFQDVYYGVEQKNADMKSIGISNIVKGIWGTIAFCIAALLTNNLNIALFIMFLSILAVLIFLDKRYSSKYMAEAAIGKWSNAYKMLWICGPVALNNFMTNYILAYPKLAVEQHMGEEALGIYSSIGMPVLIVQMAASYIFVPLITTFAEYLQKEQITAFYKLLLRVIFMTMLLGMTAFLMAKSGGSLFLKIVFGEEISEYVDILYPLILCTTLTALVWFFNALLIVCRDYVSLCISSMISVVILFWGSYGMIEKYSYNGATFALCLALSAKIFIMSVRLIKRVNV